MKPMLSYLENGGLDAVELVNDEYRKLELDGIAGINLTSIKNKIILPRHNLKQERGSLSLKIFALEDLSVKTYFCHMSLHLKNPWHYPILTDNENMPDFTEASFAFSWSSQRHPLIMAKFFRGDYNDAFTRPMRACVAGNFFYFQKNQWYQMTLSWDKAAKSFRMYINGILVGAEDPFFQSEFVVEECGDRLFAGNPTFCLADIHFYDEFIDQADAAALFESTGIPVDPVTHAAFRRMHTGENLPAFDWQPDAEWRDELTLPLTNPADLERFYVQGNQDGQPPRITDKGLLIETYQGDPGHNFNYSEGRKHIYLMTDRAFEGDLYLEIEYQPLKQGGLALFMFQASGMQREDFMKDYALRTSGTMRMITREDVRNYHWEFFRQMNDVRGDVNSTGLTKHPFQRKLGYGCYPGRLETNQWHKAQVLQIGDRFICAVNGKVVIDARDYSDQNHGPIYSFGRVGLRCMVNTRMLFRNFKVMNRKPPFTVLGK